MADLPSILATIEVVASRLSLCRNRLWEITKSISKTNDRVRFLQIIEEADVAQTAPQKHHEECTFDFCERSRLDFTAVAQRHEGCTSNSCSTRQFMGVVLETAIASNGLTAWRLDGDGLVQRPGSFMAVSHVWSDGTGAGAWPPGHVNECLYGYFSGIAGMYGCDGIWWDTICIPREKAARSKAIFGMQRNYEEASFTLIHDGFIRGWEFINPMVACFTIVVSPWFSRGWTALELAGSRKVKVVFKDCIKDLDEDILGNLTTTDLGSAAARWRKHRIASEVIERLRKRKVENVDHLLQVLGSRHTSWPRDVAIICGQLAGISAKPRSSQQEIYQAILKKVENITRENLFHNSVTMKGLTWCPTSLFSLRPSSTDSSIIPSSITIASNGDIRGEWAILTLTEDLKERFNWRDVHPLVEAKVKDSLKDPDEHLLLIFENPVARALVVRKENSETTVQFIGPLYFHPPLTATEVQPTADFTIVASPMPDIEKPIGALTRVRTMAPPRDEDGNSLLHLAAVNGDVRHLDLAESSLNLSNGDGMTALQLAARHGHIDVVNQLIKAGANPDLADTSSWTALHHAVWHRHDEVARILMALSDLSRLETLDRPRRLLHLAADRGSVEISRDLVQLYSVPVKVVCKKGRTPLHCAAWAASANVMKLLLEQPAMYMYPNAADADGKTPLHIAAELGHTSVVEVLLHSRNLSGVDVNIQDHMERTALHLAVQNGHEVVAWQLLRASANVEVEDKMGLTTLLIAVRKGRAGLIRTLLQAGADIESEGSSGRTALTWACAGGREEIVRTLIDAGADMTFNSHDGQTPLLSAAENGHMTIVQQLLQAGIDPDFRAEGGRTPLLWAAENGHREIISVLLDAGAAIDVYDDAHRTPLIVSVKNRHYEAMELLLQRGSGKAVEFSSVDHLGRTALAWAAVNGDEKAIGLLLAHGASLKTKDNGWNHLLMLAISENSTDAAAVQLVESLIPHTGDKISEPDFEKTIKEAAGYGWERTVSRICDLKNSKGVRYKETIAWFRFNGKLMESAILNKHPSIVKILLDAGFSPSLGTLRNGKTLLILAVETEQAEVVRMLLDAGADPNTTDFEYESALFYAARLPDGVGIIELLLAAGADVNQRKEEQWTVLYEAVEHGREANLKRLLEGGADPSAKGGRIFGFFGPSLLDKAMENKENRNANTILHLLNNGAKPGRWDAEILIWSLKNGHNELAKTVLRKSNMNANASSSVTELPPFEIAGDTGNVEMMEFLLARGARIPPDYMPYKLLSDPGKLDAALLILGNGGGHGTPDVESGDLLIFAVKHGHKTLARVLLEIGQQRIGEIGYANAQDNSGRTSMSWAAQYGHLEILEMLFKCRANPEISDDNGQTPFFYAIENIEAVRLLIRYGAQVEARDHQGRTPLSRAMASGQREVVKLLSKGRGALSPEANTLLDVIFPPKEKSVHFTSPK